MPDYGQIIGACVLAIMGAVFHSLQEDNPLVMFSGVFDVLERYNGWLVQRLGLSSKIVIGAEIVSFFGIGGLMLELGQYFIAVLVWLVIGFMGVSKAFHWSGIEGNEKATRSVRMAWVVGAFLGCAFLVTATNLSRGDRSWFGIPKKVITTAMLDPVSFRLGCELDRIPITVPAASTIHVIRVHPGLLSRNPTILDQGLFQDISSSATVTTDWPSKLDGRWMSTIEIHKFAVDKHILPYPFASRCTLSSYGAGTLDEIVVPLLVDTPDGKRHSYPVAFDPLMSGHSFLFYIVSACSSGVIPTLVQWDDYATVHVLGEQKTRRVPVRYEKRNWPSQLLAFGGSSFVWNGLNNCQWDEQQ